MAEHLPYDHFNFKPAGVFINELTDVIKNAENEPPIITGIDMKNVSIYFKSFPSV